MALSKFHIVISMLAYYQRKSNLDEAPMLIPYLILPDAIRCFSFGTKEDIPNTRVITHFEKHPITGNASGMKFPTPKELKKVDDEFCKKSIQALELNYNQVAIGDKTSLEAFWDCNYSMPKKEYTLILSHLIQDSIYDDYIRKSIDCTNGRTKQEFYFNGTTYDPTAVRKLIGEIEEQEFQYLCKMFKEQTGIEVTAQWFEKEIKPIIFEAYPEKMAETTWKYIKFQEEPAKEIIEEEKISEMLSKMLWETKKLLETI